jgi:biotin carboxylase
MPRVLLVASTTGYQTRAFDTAAATLGIELVYATDRCTGLDDPWHDAAIPVRFHEQAASVARLVAATRDRRVDAVLGVGDRPAVLAARAAAALGLPGHSPEGAAAATSKLLSRGRFTAAGLPMPWFFTMPLDATLDAVADRIAFPCVVKPLALSGSRGVMRADTPEAFTAAVARLRALLLSPEIRALKDPAHDEILVEGFVPGPEFALEGVTDASGLRVFAVFEKPDPLDGPFFEETVYLTPALLSRERLAVCAATVAHAAASLGLHHGPVHAEFRLSPAGVFVLEVAPRPIGGLCARALRFAGRGQIGLSLERLLLQHALGDTLEGYGLEALASAVMMVPIPRRGHYAGVDGLEDARAVDGVEDVVMTAKPGQLMIPLPEGGSYLGFIFARASTPAAACAAVRAAHARLRFRFETPLAVMPAGQPAALDASRADRRS